MKVGRGSPAVMVRMPEDLKAWLKHQAIDNRRTLNAEVLHRLEQTRLVGFNQAQGAQA